MSVFAYCARDTVNHCRAPSPSDAHKFPGRFLGLSSPQQQMLGLLRPACGAQAVYNTGSGRELCCWRRLFIAHKRPTALKKKEKKNPECHPESSIIVPILFPAQKDHLLAARDSVRRENRTLWRSDALARLSLPPDRSIQAPGFDARYRVSFFHVWEISHHHHHHLRLFWNTLSANAEWDKQAQGEKNGLKRRAAETWGEISVPPRTNLGFSGLVFWNLREGKSARKHLYMKAVTLVSLTERQQTRQQQEQVLSLLKRLNYWLSINSRLLVWVTSAGAVWGINAKHLFERYTAQTKDT